MTDLIGARNVGARVKRAEDPRILTGRGRYIDDVVLPGMLHGAFLRSTVAHGRLRSIDVSAARELPGVVAVFTGEDMAALSTPAQAGQTIGMTQVPGMKLPAVYGLATDKVRFVGDPIALVVAESRYVAEDALDLIDIDVEMLEPIVTYADALDPAKPPLFDELADNVAYRGEMALGDVDGAFARAARVVTASISVHRHQPVPMEGRGSIGSWDAAEGKMTFYTSTQSPHMVRQLLAPQIGVPMEQIRVLSGDVGGGFGLKNTVFREDVAVAVAAKALERPVKWVEDRMEHLAAGGQAREEMADIEAAVTADGVLLGLRMDNKLNAGAYPSDPFPGAMFVNSLATAFQGPTRIEGLAATSTSVFSNKGTYVSYRGPWATGDFLRERMLDVVARELDLDPLEVRRRNYVVRGEPPLAMLTGQPFAGVTTRECLEQAAAIVDWDGFRRRQAEARRDGRYLGIGVASYLEAAPGPRVPGQLRGGGILGDETTHVWLERDGKVVVVTQQHPHGQGHQTTLAQVVADELGVAFEDVEVRYGDTDVTPYALVATGGSRAATMANGAVLHASRELRQRVLSLAAELFEASAADLEISDGTVAVKGSPATSMPLGELVRVVEEEPGRLPAGTDTELKVTRVFDGGEGGWSGGTHVCEVEVDVETGLVHVDRYVVVEDCGVPVNPAIVEGQIRGGVTQAIGAVLLERSAYGDDGQFLASTFMDYLLPTTTEVPNFEIHHVDTVPLDPDVNFRGVGEGGMIVAPAAITNAIEDALATLGVRVREQHLPPARLLELIGTVPAE
ncbi:MAG TPA: xanthine dehydrogenase family protein molybdopterin-binding subunit [Acidimicrobiales bacterium]|nr:xanthine dehydrogenase family protein molybdopterin-binding subunit [Acidimicrobiales bacterium]